MPNHLVVFDVDDTLFHVEVGIDVYLKDGFTFVERITPREWDRRSLLPVYNDFVYKYDSFSCSTTFRNTSEPIQEIIDICKRKLDDPNTTVAFVTARDRMDDMAVYVDLFHHHGMMIRHDHVEFVGTGDNTPSHVCKTPAFERLLKDNIWNSAMIYDDNKNNLRVFREIANDLDIPVETVWVDKYRT